MEKNKLREGVSSFLELGYFTPIDSRELAEVVISSGSVEEIAQLAKKSADKGVLARLVGSRYAKVRAAVAENQMISLAQLDELCADSSPTVVAAAKLGVANFKAREASKPANVSARMAGLFANLRESGSAEAVRDLMKSKLDSAEAREFAEIVKNVAGFKEIRGTELWSFLGSMQWSDRIYIEREWASVLSFEQLEEILAKHIGKHGDLFDQDTWFAEGFVPHFLEGFAEILSPELMVRFANSKSGALNKLAAGLVITPAAEIDRLAGSKGSWSAYVASLNPNLSRAGTVAYLSFNAKLGYDDAFSRATGRWGIGILDDVLDSGSLVGVWYAIYSDFSSERHPRLSLQNRAVESGVRELLEAVISDNGAPSEVLEKIFYVESGSNEYTARRALGHQNASVDSLIRYSLSKGKVLPADLIDRVEVSRFCELGVSSVKAALAHLGARAREGRGAERELGVGLSEEIWRLFSRYGIDNKAALEMLLQISPNFDGSLQDFALTCGSLGK